MANKNLGVRNRLSLPSSTFNPTPKSVTDEITPATELVSERKKNNISMTVEQTPPADEDCN